MIPYVIQFVHPDDQARGTTMSEMVTGTANTADELAEQLIAKVGNFIYETGFLHYRKKKGNDLSEDTIVSDFLAYYYRDFGGDPWDIVVFDQNKWIHNCTIGKKELVNHLKTVPIA